MAPSGADIWTIPMSTKSRGRNNFTWPLARPGAMAVPISTWFETRTTDHETQEESDDLGRQLMY